MPAKSVAQRRLFAIAEHHPDELQSKNKKILGSMSKDQMHDYASTKEEGLPEKVSKDEEPHATNAARLEKVKKIRNLRSM